MDGSPSNAICASFGPLNPFKLENMDYFQKRVANGAKVSALLAENRRKLAKLQKGVCPLCDEPLLNGEPLEVHHVAGRRAKNWDATRNLRLLHKLCHDKITYSKDPKTRALVKDLGLLRETPGK